MDKTNRGYGFPIFQYFHIRKTCEEPYIKYSIYQNTKPKQFCLHKSDQNHFRKTNTKTRYPVNN